MRHDGSIVRWTFAIVVGTATAGATTLGAPGFLPGFAPGFMSGEAIAAELPKAPLDVRIDSQAKRLTPGADVSYVIRVRNRSDRPYPLAVVNQLLPTGLDQITAIPAPVDRTSEALRWQVDVPALEEIRVQVRGKVSHNLDTRPWSVSMAFSRAIGSDDHLATTACVAPDAAGRIAGCATAVNAVIASTPWWASIYALVSFAGALVAAFALLLLIWRPRSGVFSVRQKAG